MNDPRSIVDFSINLNARTEAEWAYLAGLFDGEGCVTLRMTRKESRKSAYLEGNFTIVNTHEGVIDWLVATFGGKKFKSSKPRKAYWKQGYTWYCTPQQGCILLTKMLPYLRIKRAQAEVFIQAIALLKNNRTRRLLSEDEKTLRQTLVTELKRLNDRRSSVAA